MDQSVSAKSARGAHELRLSCREKGNLSGIEKVISSCETSLQLVSSCGGLTITGEKLKIVQFNAQTGALDFEGTVHAVKYSAPKQPLLKRLFK
ncbi:MAG: hypothetical protein HFE46_08435 [Clostridia bacterium]|jgi:sporulation protein YabP|nr:hypothetical protein [Clostridia bacterium]